MSELWKLSKKVYREIVFQSIFSLRAGGTLPQGGDIEKNTYRFVKNAEINTMISKALMVFFIVFLGGFTSFLGGVVKVDKELASICGVSTMLSSILFMITFMGLQVATSLVSTKVADFLIPLPVSKKDVSKIILMCFIRIFDIPLVAAALIVPILYGVSYYSILGALTVLLGIIITEIFALALAVFLAISFYSKVIRGGGKSAWRMFMRIIYMLIWVVPTFLMYAITSFATQMLNLMGILTQSFSYLLASLYPFSLGFLVSFATFFNVSDSKILILSVGSSLIYFTLAAYSFRWLLKK
ncbi:MAG: hypothetical protein QXF52_02835 [Thermoproteota archaeon]